MAIEAATEVVTTVAEQAPNAFKAMVNLARENAPVAAAAVGVAAAGYGLYRLGKWAFSGKKNGATEAKAAEEVKPSEQKVEQEAATASA